MTDHEALMREELERLARAHVFAEGAAARGDSESEPLEVNPDVAENLKMALHASMTGSTPEMTAIVTVSASTPLPAEWLFRLESPVATVAALEERLAVPSETLKSVSAMKSAAEDSLAEMVDFVFVTPDIKARIGQMVRDGTLDIAPLFVKVTKTCAVQTKPP